jgi:hypothetical protein
VIAFDPADNQDDCSSTLRVSATAGALAVVVQRHLRWVGMRLSRWQLAGWSVVRSSADGAGLMLLPVFVFPVDEHVSAFDLHRGVMPVAATALIALVVHVAAMIITCGAVALIVYQTAGLSFLRRTWLNLDKVWAFALIGVGTATLLST